MDKTNPGKWSGLIRVLLCMGYDEDDFGKLTRMDFTQSQVFGLNNELDILTVVHHKFDFDTLFDRSRKFVNVQGSAIHFLHLNDIRELKILARRPQDLRDVVMIDDFLKIRKEK